MPCLTLFNAGNHDAGDIFERLTEVVSASVNDFHEDTMQQLTTTIREAERLNVPCEFQPLKEDMFTALRKSASDSMVCTPVIRMGKAKILIE